GRSRQKGGIGAETRDEAPKEDDLGAVLEKDVASKFHSAFMKGDVPAVAQQEAIAAKIADAEAYVVSHHCTGDRSGDHQFDGELVAGASVDGGGDKHGLAGQRDPDA